METINQVKKSRVASVVERMPTEINYSKAFIFIAGVALAAWVLWGLIFGFSTADRSTYQAVFLTNNQVYFGKLKMGLGDFLTLKDAHYLVVASPAQQQTAGTLPFTLNVLPVEIQPQAPIGKLYISKKQVLFWENLKPDSPAVQIIGDQKAAAQQ